MRNLLARSCVAAAILLAMSSATAQQRPALPTNADPNDWNSYFDRGVDLLKGHEVRAADDMFAWAARLDPSRAEPLYARFVAFHMLDVRRFGDYLRDDERTLRDPGVHAADSLQLEALVRNPFVHRGLVALAYDQLPGEWGSDAYTHAFLEYANGDMAGAARDMDQLVRRHPRDWRGRHDLAISLVYLRRYGEAREQLDSVLAVLRRADERRVQHVYESKDMLVYAIGMLELAQNRHDDARDAFAQAVLEDASQWYVHRGLAMALVAGGHPADALPEYRTALELAGEHPVLLSEYGRALYAAGQYPAAVEQLKKLVVIDPEWADAWLALGNAQACAGDNAAAVQAFDAYLARAPRTDAETAGRVRALADRLRAGG
ncbi:MAG: tetratricopeptide repeat protein [Gemmatimonadetes bacterium]|nr:tetratricopeptide repeat protein [Gemmatimonadota bacterium]